MGKAPISRRADAAKMAQSKNTKPRDARPGASRRRGPSAARKGSNVVLESINLVGQALVLLAILKHFRNLVELLVQFFHLLL